MKTKLFFLIAAIALFWHVSSAQVTQERVLGSQTTGFSYQGSLKTAGAPANGNHDFEFRLWDSVSGGTQVGATVALPGVAVINGIFSVTLDFGDQYPDAFRFLEVRVRPTGGGAFTTLTPREQIKAVPYAVKSLNAEQLGGVAASQYVTTTTGGANFIQNTTTQQASSNFNISGDGIVGGNLGVGTTSPTSKLHVVSGNAVLQLTSTAPGPGQTGVHLSSNLGSGPALRYSIITDGNGDLSIYQSSGANILHVNSNGNIGLGGLSDSQYPLKINRSVTAFSGDILTAGNTQVGGRLGVSGNVGIGTTTPSERLHIVGNGRIDGGIGVLGNGEFGGILAVTGNGIFGGSVGIGTSAPQQTLHVNGLEVLSTGNSSGFKFRSRGSTSSGDDWVWYANLNIARLFKAGVGDLLTIQPTGEFAINVLGSAGTIGVCRNASNQISTCSSSKRYKQNINSYSSGLSLIKQLRPVSFNWKQGGMADLGLVAEEVADVEPLLTTTNDKGEVEGVKYDRIGVIAVNAIKEQQAEISEQAKKIGDQQKQIDDLKKIVCSLKPDAEVCRVKE